MKQKVTVTLDSETVKQIDKLAVKERRSRSTMIQVLCEAGIKSIKTFLKEV